MHAYWLEWVTRDGRLIRQQCPRGGLRAAEAAYARNAGKRELRLLGPNGRVVRGAPKERLVARDKHAQGSLEL